MRRVVAAVAAIASLAVLVSGCTFGGSPSPNQQKTSAPTGETVAADLAPYYGQVLTWKTCQGDFQCSTAIAPVDWANPGGARISLSLIRLPATGARKGSILVNPGGPGVATLPYFSNGAVNMADATLAEHYDIVGWDVRGVGTSSPISCGTDKQLDDYFFSIPKSTVGTDAWFAEADAQTKEFGERCLKNSGPLLGHIGAADTARDMDMLRAALGDTKLDYMGYSYGTMYGQEYAQLFPQNTGRILLDGVVDPSETSLEAAVSQTNGFEKALRAYLTDCLTRSGCPFSGTVDGAIDQIAMENQQLTESPLRNSDGRELGANTFQTAIILPLYSKTDWKYLDQLFVTVGKGDASFAFTLADSYYERDADGTYESNLFDVFMGAECLDTPATDTIAQSRAEFAKVTDVSTIFGSGIVYAPHQCAAWPEKPTREIGPITAPGSPDILVVGTTGDPATPFAQAQKVASSLAKGHLLTFHGEGHTAYAQGNPCVQKTVDAYMLNGTIPADGASC